MRTFEFSDAKSHKFWNIEVAGSATKVTYGRIGSAGQTAEKPFATPEKAQAEAEKLIREKLGKGYRETTTAKVTVPEYKAFEIAIGINPHDIVAWNAYADFLIEKGDPRGEFMQVQLALEDESQSPARRKKLKAKEAELLAAHERGWLGPLAAAVLDAEPVPVHQKGTRPRVGHAFARGWLSRLEFHDLTVNQARALNQAADARLLQELIVETIEAEAPVGTEERYITSFYEPGPDVPEEIDSYDGPGLHALCRCPHLKSVRIFRLGEGTGDEEYANCHTSGQLAYHLVKQMLNLEELHLLAHRVDAGKIFPLPLPKLRVLQLFHSHSYPLEKLAANKTLTNLSVLRCHPHAIEFDDDANGAYIRLAQLQAVCRSKHLANLTHLCLRLTDFGDAGAKEIVESGILKRLKILDLQGGCMTDEGAKLLAASPDLRHLEYLNLRSNALTQAGQEAIQKTGVKADFTGQHGHTSGGEDGNIAEYLFEGDIE